MATQAQRAHAGAVMDLLVANERLIHYLMKRPMTTRNLREQQLVDLFKARKTISMDCSESVTLICRLAGLADSTAATAKKIQLNLGGKTWEFWSNGDVHIPTGASVIADL